LIKSRPSFFIGHKVGQQNLCWDARFVERVHDKPAVVRIPATQQ